jgi:hypothetical protein
MRTYSVEKVKAATLQYADEIEGFSPEEWLANEKNIALINDNDDVALFEHQADLFDTVCGHYFFFSRGKDAIKAAQEFLKEAFTQTYIETITGLTPLDNKGALWMNRRLGFKEHGDVTTVVGPCRFVMLTKAQWKDTTNYE